MVDPSCLQSPHFKCTLLIIYPRRIITNINKVHTSIYKKKAFADRSEAYQLIEDQIGPMEGALPLNVYDLRARGNLLLEVKFEAQADTTRAINDGVTVDDIVYKASPSVAGVENPLVRIQLTLLQIAKPEDLKQGLLSSLRYFGKVYQIRRVLRNGYFEGRMTITLDPSKGYVDDNGNMHDPHPLQRMIYLESWDVFAPASYKGAAPICYYCRQAGHIRSACPDLANRQCFGCGNTGHTRRFCRTKPTAPATSTTSEPSETQLLDQYLQQSTSAHDEKDENSESNNVTTVTKDTVDENVDLDDQPMEHASKTTPEIHEQHDLLNDEHMDMEDEVIDEQKTRVIPALLS